jgi:hypothetical protein
MELSVRDTKKQLLTGGIQPPPDDPLNKKLCMQLHTLIPDLQTRGGGGGGSGEDGNIVGRGGEGEIEGGGGELAPLYRTHLGGGGELE